MQNQHNIAVILPCYNEALSIKQVIDDFRLALPNSTIFVYDNNSSDNTAEIALAAGAIVRKETRKGKGHVVRAMFADIDADIYVLADGDATYDASKAPQLIEKLLSEQLDMVVGTREEQTNTDENAYRFGHRFGNALFTKIVTRLFGSRFTDIFSGYRVFSHRFVKTFPSQSKGFEIETEFTIHSLEMRLPVGEMKTPYFARPEGSHSKLNSFRDGIRILFRIVLLLKETRPLLFFGGIFLVLATLSILLFFPVLLEYLETGLIPRIPTAILSTGIMLLAFISLTCGIILDTVSRQHRILKRLLYLATPFLRK